jgi:hypothetical protein
MPITVICPICSHSGQAPDAYAGRTVRCKKCSAEFRVSAAIDRAVRAEPAKVSGAKTAPVPPARSPFPRDPVAYTHGRGHAEFPCLSRTYSPGSRVPCADFSPWLCERVRANDADALADFVWRVVQANPGAGVGDDAFRTHWQDHAKQILGFRLDHYLHTETPDAFTELRAALVLVLLHDNFGGFVMASDAPHYLATVMLPYVFKTVEVEELIRRANGFIRHMRKDSPFWEDFPLFKPAGLDPWNEPRPEEATGFCRVLRTLPLATRDHLFDFASLSDRRASSGSQPLDQATSYGTRKRGIDAEESARLLLQSGLLVRSDDPRGALQRLTVKELTEFLAQQSVQGGKGRRKDKLIEAAMDRCPQAVAEKAKGVCIARLAPQYASAVAWAHKHIDRSVPFFQVWLGFAFENSPLAG